MSTPILTRLEELDAYWSQHKVVAYCYVCGMPFEIYEGLPTEPPTPDEIKMFTETSQIKTVYTCPDPACRTREMKRQDAIYAFVLAPKLEAWKEDRAAYVREMRTKKH